MLSSPLCDAPAFVRDKYEPMLLEKWRFFCEGRPPSAQVFQWAEPPDALAPGPFAPPLPPGTPLVQPVVPPSAPAASPQTAPLAVGASGLLAAAPAASQLPPPGSVALGSTSQQQQQQQQLPHVPVLSSNVGQTALS